MPTPPSVLVTDANHNPVPGVDVTFQVTSGRGQVTPAVVATDNSGIAQVGWSPGSKGSNVLTATAAGAGISGNPVTFTATGTSAFDIEVQFLGSATASQRQAFTDAAERWESLVTGDLENIPLQTLADDCGEGSPALNQTIDDLLIFVTLEHIDGPGGVLGSAGPCFIRNSNNLSVLGAMIFDNADLADIEDAGLLQVLILHEMGHVLGFGSLWPAVGLLADPSLPPATGTDPHFTGAQAITAFNQVGGNAYTGAKVPVENTGGEGTADGHWRESVFINELMTGFVDLGENPLSVVTVSSLADQGYAVNKVGVDPYSLTLSLRALGGRHRFQLGSDLLRIPIRKVDRAGRVDWILPEIVQREKNKRDSQSGVPFADGGAGNRTLVRVSFQNCVYVCRLDFPPSLQSRYRADLPEAYLLKISPDAPERHDQPAQICDSMSSAPGGLHPSKEHKRALAQLTQPMPVQSWQLNHSRRFNQEPGPGHAAIPSSNPSKPSRPRVEEL